MPPRVREVELILRKRGFVERRKGKGDYRIFEHPDRPGVIVVLDDAPDHEVPRGTLAAIRRAAGLSREEMP